MNRQESLHEFSLRDILAADYKSLAQLYPQYPKLQSQVFSLAQAHREKLPVQPIVIAGSNGKTSVKEIVGEIFRNWMNDSPSPVVVSPENQNTKTALALQILNLNEKASYAVFEVGARKPGDLQMAYGFLAPQVAVLLNIGQAHLGEFGSNENLVHEKLSALDGESLKCLVYLYDDPRIKKTVTSILHSRESLQERPEKELKVFSFGTHSGSDVQIIEQKIVSCESHGAESSASTTLNKVKTDSVEAESHIEITFRVRGEDFVLKTPVIAPQLALNFAAAWATALAFDIPTSIIVNTLQAFKGVSRRFERYRITGREVIDDAFNSSPESLTVGLEMFRALLNSTGEDRTQKVLLVLGSMLELGNSTEVLHQEMGQTVCRLFGDLIVSASAHVVFVGPETQAAAEICRRFLSAKEVENMNLISHFDSLHSAETVCRELFELVDLVYLKGSKSLQIQKLLSVFRS